MLAQTAPAAGYGSEPPFEDSGTAVDLRPFQLNLPVGHVFGDWGGIRTGLEQYGIKPSLDLEVDTAANPSGGKREGITEASNLGLDLLFDLDKIGGIKGGSFLLQFSERWGDSLSKQYIGNLFDTQQVYGGETFRLVDAASRPTDECGLAVLYGHFSDDLRGEEHETQLSNPSTVVQDFELAMELGYRFYFVNHSVYFQPDLQYIIHPDGDGNADDVAVVGCRVGMNF
jgi:carbohydrate-selective porin OprB